MKTEETKNISQTLSAAQSPILSVIADVVEERKRQTEKWGVQNNHPMEWIGILTEEVGEAAKEANEYHFKNDVSIERPEEREILQTNRLFNYRAEMVQVAAVAIQAIEDLDRNLESILERLKEEIYNDNQE